MAAMVGRRFGKADECRPVGQTGSGSKGNGKELAQLMSHPFIDDPKYWHERAAEARSIAKLLDDQEAKGHLLAIAAEYDQLAEQMKRRSNNADSVN
jgi:hypothetical protein